MSKKDKTETNLLTQTDLKTALTTPNPYKENPWRFINLSIYFYQHYLIGMSISSINSIAPTITQAYKIPEEKIILANSLLLTFGIIGGITSAIILEKIGLKKSNVIFSIFSLIGVVIRCFIYETEVVLLVGQVFCGFGNSFIVSSEMLFFRNWFLERNIKFWFCFIGLGIFFGNGFGSLIPFLFIDENEKDLDILSSQIQRSLELHIYLYVINLLFSLFLFKEKPKKGFGYIEEIKVDHSITFAHFKKDLKYLFTNKLFILLTLIVGFGRGNVIVILALFNIFSKKNDFSEISGSFTLITFIVFGLTGSLISDKIIKNKKKIKHKLILFSFLGIITLLISFSFFFLNQEFFFHLIFSFSGFFLINQYPLAFTIIILYIKIDNISLMNAIVFIASQVFAILTQSFLIHFMEVVEKNYFVFFGGLLVVYLIPFVFSLFLKIK